MCLRHILGRELNTLRLHNVKSLFANRRIGITLQALYYKCRLCVEFYGSHVIPFYGILRGTMYYVYFLESLQDKSHYIGYSPDLKKRLKKHNNKQVTSTKQKIPWKLIYYEAYLDRKDAVGREKFLKSGSGWRFLKKQLLHYLHASP